MLIKLVKSRLKDVQLWVGDNPLPLECEVQQTIHTVYNKENINMLKEELTISVRDVRDPDNLTVACTREAIFYDEENASTYEAQMAAYHQLFLLTRQDVVDLFIRANLPVPQLQYTDNIIKQE